MSSFLSRGLRRESELSPGGGHPDRRQAPGGRRARSRNNHPAPAGPICAGTPAHRRHPYTAAPQTGAGPRRRHVPRRMVGEDSVDRDRGLGPFVLSEHVPGQRLVFARNPHYWRKDGAGVSLPYLDKLTLVLASQATEAIRLQAGEIDLMTNADIRPEDYAAFKRVADQGRVRLIDNGVGLDPNLLWFNLSKVHADDPRNAWLRHKAFRQAVSCAVDRQAIVNTVYLGAAVPIYGPITPANRTWYTDLRPACEYDRAKARDLFQSAGLADRNGDGLFDDAAGVTARFSILTQAAHVRSRVGTVIQEQLRQSGLTVDLVPLDQGAMLQRYTQGNYDSIYFGIQASAMDPALNPGFWMSSGNFHFWNPGQKAPSSDWERRIDDLMRRQGTTPQLAERQRLFAEAQRIFIEELPAIYSSPPR